MHLTIREVTPRLSLSCRTRGFGWRIAFRLDRRGEVRALPLSNAHPASRGLSRCGIARLTLLPLTLGALALSGCYGGSYPVDYFREMHYQESQRLLEADRLSPPDGAVPRTGARPQITFAEASGLQNPMRRTPETQQAARATFNVNCGVCHGEAGNGRSFVSERFTNAKVVPPADLTASRVRNRSDGELYWIVNNGIGNMPPFRELLTEDQVWLMVLQIRELQGQR